MLFGIPVPDHDSAILGTGYDITVLTDVALRPSYTGDNVIVSVDRLTHFACHNRKYSVSERTMAKVFNQSGKPSHSQLLAKILIIPLNAHIKTAWVMHFNSCQSRPVHVKRQLFRLVNFLMCINAVHTMYIQYMITYWHLHAYIQILQPSTSDGLN